MSVKFKIQKLGQAILKRERPGTVLRYDPLGFPSLSLGRTIQDVGKCALTPKVRVADLGRLSLISHAIMF